MCANRPGFQCLNTHKNANLKQLESPFAALIFKFPALIFNVPDLTLDDAKTDLLKTDLYQPQQQLRQEVLDTVLVGSKLLLLQLFLIINQKIGSSAEPCQGPSAMSVPLGRQTAQVIAGRTRPALWSDCPILICVGVT